MNNALHHLRRLFGLPIQRATWKMQPDNTYREAFERLWNANSAEVVSNSQTEHAATLLTVFFERASNRVGIFCKNLNPAVYDTPELLEAAKKAVEKGINIEILVQEKPNESSLFFQFVRGAKNSDGTKILLNTGEGVPKLSEIKQNFAFVDERAYRFEESNHVTVAYASSNQPKTVKILSDFFESLKGYVRALNATVSA